MRILLDTHIFLWFISSNPQLSNQLRDNICDPNNEIYLSSVSIWEVIVKYQLGKLPLGAWEKIRYQSIRNNGYIPFG